MSVRELADYEGPREPHDDERDAVKELTRFVFFPQKPTWEEGCATWPMGMHPDTQAGLLVMFTKAHGRGPAEPVSVIARLARPIHVFGHALRMGYIGGVCTHPDHRGKGLASAALRASFKRLQDDGADVVWISGTRKLYFGAGANHIGGFSQCAVTRECLRAQTGLTLRRATSSDVPLLCRLNERDSVRFVRPPLDYEIGLSSGHCAGRACEFWIAEIQDVPAAYVLMRRESAEACRVVEFCGERTAVMGALSRLAAELGDASLTILVPGRDVLADLLAGQGLKPEVGRTDGTIKLLDFCATMNRLRPYFASHLEPELVASLKFAEGDGRYEILSRDGSVTIDGETDMLWTLLGVPAGEGPPGVEATGEVRQLLDICLPIPLPSPYLNMI